ncbi:hypothetical protein GCM10009654_52220 [Streptomyces hebeiensis]|uniref:Uncharacterized protein n=1 Tax=Streptomyces hebeiensis TaxID=229486 RepID=A0ABP4FN84_9ACTN|nr:hypothetical protein [Streptomyces sp. NRRL F-5135]
MAKNKNRDRGGKQHHRSTSERTGGSPKSSSTEERAEERLTNITPADVERKGRRRRFGHN